MILDNPSLIQLIVIINPGASGATDFEHCGAYNWAQQGTAFQVDATIETYNVL